MTMSKKTSKMLRGAVKGQFIPGSVVHGYNLSGDSPQYRSNVLKYWKSKGWIKRSGDMYTLTKKGYNQA